VETLPHRYSGYRILGTVRNNAFLDSVADLQLSRQTSIFALFHWKRGLLKFKRDFSQTKNQQYNLFHTVGYGEIPYLKITSEHEQWKRNKNPHFKKFTTCFYFERSRLKIRHPVPVYIVVTVPIICIKRATGTCKERFLRK
jgi:hypothetical protein